jgi:hypothetical protein
MEGKQCSTCLDGDVKQYISFMAINVKVKLSLYLIKCHAIKMYVGVEM